MAATATVRPEADSAQQQHRLRVVGYLHGSRGTRRVREHPLPVELPRHQVCHSPLLWACDDGCCLAARPCSNHRESRCAPCASRYRRRVSRLIEAGIGSPRSREGHLYLLTVNAPGDAGHSKWIPGRPGKHGLCSCSDFRNEGDGAWNASAGSRWNHLRTSLGDLMDGIEYVRVVEVQQRGLLHLHIVIWSPEPLSALVVQEKAMTAGFGCVMDLAPLDSAEKTARYLAKYVAKAVDVRTQVPWRREVVDEETGEVVVKIMPTYRAWSSSRSWPIRMAMLVEASRRAVAIAAARQREWEEGEEEAPHVPPQVGKPPAPPG